MPSKEPSPQQKPPLSSPFPIVGKPIVSSYPTPRVEDSIVKVRIDTRIGNYKVPKPGDPYTAVDQTNKLTGKFKFAKSTPVEQLPGFTDHFYVRDFADQERYNYTVSFPYTDHNFPKVIRTYIIPRTSDVITTQPRSDMRDPADKRLQLTDQELKRFENDPVLDGIFVQAVRTFERLPGPVIKSFDANQYQQIVTVLTQEVEKSAPPAQSAVTEVAKQERTTKAKVKNTLAAVPDVFPQTGLTTEIPSMTRELWLGGFDEEQVSQVSAGEVSQPVLNTPGTYSIAEEQQTEYKKKVVVRSLPMPQTRIHMELTGEFGGGMLQEELQIDTPTSNLAAQEGFLITESKLRNLAGFGKIAQTKSLFELEPANIEVMQSGLGYTSAPAISFNPPGAQAVAVMGRAVALVDVVTGGSQYDFPPAVSFVPQARDAANVLTPATAIAYISKGITGAFMSRLGTGYRSAPAVVFSGGGGSGAAATAVVGFPLDSIQVQIAGTHYKKPVITISGGGGAGARASVKPKNINQVHGGIYKITLDNTGSGYTSAPTVTITDQNTVSGGSGATAVARLSTNGRIKALVVTNVGENYLFPPAISFVGGGGSGAQAQCSLTAKGVVNNITVTSGGVGYTVPPFVVLTGGSRNPVQEATAVCSLTSTLQVARIILTVPGTGPGYTPGAPDPQVIFSGGGGSGAVGFYNIGGWPILYGSTVDAKYGLVTNITKRIVPAGTQWRPGLGFTEVHPHDKWRSIMITSRNDPRSIPSPVIYPTVREVSLPSTLIAVIPNWQTTTEDSVEGELPYTPGGGFGAGLGGYEKDSAMADISGSFDVQVAHGYHGPAAGMVMELFFPEPPDPAVLPLPLNILPSYGTVQIRSQSNLVSAFAVATGGIKSRRYGQTSRTTTKVETRTIGPVLTGPFMETVTQSADDSATGWTPTPVPIEITDDVPIEGITNTTPGSGLYQPVGFSASTAFVYYAPTEVQATANATLTVSIPPSNPPVLPTGICFLDAMQTDRLGLGVWKVTLIFVYVP